MAARKTWGGPRRGAGRKPGPSEAVRNNRVTATFTDAELATLERLAEERGLPVGTLIHQIVMRSLRRR
jgi:hypothetical protein